jgi:hypothetical protein
MPYFLRADKTHGVQVIAVSFTTETNRRILNMPSGVKFEYADKSLARPGRKQATATEDSEFHISSL